MAYVQNRQTEMKVNDSIGNQDYKIIDCKHI